MDRRRASPPLRPQMGEEQFNALLSETGTLQTILSYHVTIPTANATVFVIDKVLMPEG
jgi:uncharacterized surface protein with fasciclin (FAS1) repeats